MKGLLIKDLQLLKMQKSFVISMGVIGIVMSITSSNLIFPLGFFPFVLSMFSLSSISYDEFDNGYAFLFSLPISRTIYVIEKYVFSVLLAVGAMFVATLVIFFIALARQIAFPSDYALILLIMFSILLIMQALMLPFQLKFGAEKARIAILGTVGMLTVIIVLIGRFLSRMNWNLNPILHTIVTAPKVLLVCAALLIGVSILLLSIRASIRIVEKKEF